MVTAVGSEVIVNAEGAGSQRDPHIVRSGNGYLAVYDEVGATENAIKVQRLDANGNRIGSAIVVAATSTSSFDNPRLVVLADGSFVVVWDQWTQWPGRDVYTRHFSAAGDALNAAMRFHSASAGEPINLDVAALADGGYAFYWMHVPAEPLGVYGYVTRVDSSDVVVSNNASSLHDLWLDLQQLGIATLTPGVRGYFNNDGETQFAYLHQLNGAGTDDDTITPGTIVSDDSMANLTLYQVASDRFVVLWHTWSYTTGSTINIRGMLFDGAMNPIGDAFDVTTSGQASSEFSLAAGENGTFSVMWYEFDDDDVHARVFSTGNAAPLPTLSLAATSAALREGETRKITVSLSAVATEDITFTYAFVDGTARYGADLTSDGKVKQVTIKAGQQSVDITLKGLHDLTAESTESLTLRLISATGATLGTTTEATVRIVDRPLKDTAALFETNGKLLMMATLAEASYVWGATEADQPELNAQRLAAQTVAKGWLTLLTAYDLPNLDLKTNSGSRWSSNGLENGVYHYENGAALLGRTSDALFVAFRGTNDFYDKLDWPLRGLHFNLFDDTDNLHDRAYLIEELVDYVIASRASGAPITKIYITGHSLGAAMVSPAWHAFQEQLQAKLGTNNIAIEGVAFANPGASYGFDAANPKIANFWNGADIIQGPTLLSTVEGDHYKLNNLARDILFTGVNPFDAHSAELYRSAIAFLFAEGQAHGVRLDLAALDTGLRGFQIERISYGIKQTGADSFAIGQGKDFIVAGAFEILQDAMVEFSSGVFEVLYPDAVKLLQASTESANAFKSAKGLMDGFNAADAAGLGAAALNLLGMIPGLKKLLALPLTILAAGTAIISAVEAYHESDLIMGGASNDLLYGLGGHDAIFGGEGDDELWGGSGNDLLYGGAGNDFLVADSGDDRLLGGTGNDIYVVQSASQSVEEKAGEGIDTVSSFVSYDLSGTLKQNIERLILLGPGNFSAIGNEGANTLTGNGWDNRIEGRGGADILIGGDGADGLLGGAGNDGLLGGAGYDTLDGGADKDRMFGGLGNDLFYADRFDDEVMESAGEGYDTVITTYSYALAVNAEVEVLKVLNVSGTGGYSLTGNAYNQSMTGNAGNNIFDGKSGIDTLTGLGGDDIYYVDDASDLVIEGASAGYDTVYTTVSYVLRAGVVVEKLSARPGSTASALTLRGNEFAQKIIGTAGDDKLYGQAGKDSLVGGIGKDTLEGGTEDDIYYISDARAVVVERASEGTSDQIFSSVSYTLGATSAVEVLRTNDQAATATLHLTGNDFNNQLIGNNGVNSLLGGKGNDTLFGYGGNDNLQGGANDDWLFGGAGNDTLFGGAGADRFAFDAAINAANNVDYVADFDVTLDFLHLKQTIFSGIASRGTLSADAFHIGTAAHDASDRIVYDKTSGILYYDPDGTGSIGAQQFATLGRNLALTNADFVIY